VVAFIQHVSYYCVSFIGSCCLNACWKLIHTNDNRYFRKLESTSRRCSELTYGLRCCKLRFDNQQSNLDIHTQRYHIFWKPEILENSGISNNVRENVKKIWDKSGNLCAVWKIFFVNTTFFAVRCYATAAYAIMQCLSVCVCVCPSRSWIVSKRINISTIFSPSGSQAILVFPYKTAWQYSDGNPPNGVIECTWHRQKSRFCAYICLHCMLWPIPAASAINLAATDHGEFEFITLVAGKWLSLLMAGNNDEVYGKKSQRYTEDNITQW